MTCFFVICTGRGVGASMALGGGTDLSALLPSNRVEEMESQDSHFMASNLNQQMKAMKERCACICVGRVCLSFAPLV